MDGLVNGNKNKKKVFPLFLLLAFVWFSCSTLPENENLIPLEDTPAAEAPEPTPKERETLLWEDIRKLTAAASPESLNKAYGLLSGSSIIESPEGRELAYVIHEMLLILYPLESSVSTPPVIPNASPYAFLFNQVRQGVFPVAEGRDASFLTLLIPPLSCLYSSQNSVLELSQEALRNIGRLLPQSVLPALLGGIIKEKQKLSAEALGLYRQALMLAPDCYPASVGAARAAVVMGDYSAAVNYIGPLTDRFGFKQEFSSLLGEAYLGLGNYREAGQLIERALSENPDNMHLVILRAQVLEAQGNNEQAKKLITLAERQNYRGAGLFLVKAKIQMKEGANEKAAETLKSGLSLYPDNPYLIDAYALALIRTGREREGREYLSASMDNGPGRLSGLLILIDEALASGLIEDAKGYLMRALSIADNPDILRRGYRIETLLGNTSGALGYAEKLYLSNPDSVEDAYPLIRSYILLERFEETQKLISDCLLKAKTANQRSQLNYLLSLTQKDDQKLESLRKALLENLQNLEALLAVSKFYKERGDIRQAYRYLKQASALRPGDPDINRDIQDLERLMK